MAHGKVSIQEATSVMCCGRRTHFGIIWIAGIERDFLAPIKDHCPAIRDFARALDEKNRTHEARVASQRKGDPAMETVVLGGLMIVLFMGTVGLLYLLRRL